MLIIFIISWCSLFSTKSDENNVIIKNWDLESNKIIPKWENILLKWEVKTIDGNWILKSSDIEGKEALKEWETNNINIESPLKFN